MANRSTPFQKNHAALLRDIRKPRSPRPPREARELREPTFENIEQHEQVVIVEGEVSLLGYAFERNGMVDNITIKTTGLTGSVVAQLYFNGDAVGTIAITEGINRVDFPRKRVQERDVASINLLGAGGADEVSVSFRFYPEA